ncbi:MAG: PadR family transcriptional regulator [Anaerolinea sp.]|nr:PadR family transcriptional regulator [Anaerolinea sp.]
MDLHATILGLLNWHPCSGYDLKRIISDSDLFYWSGNNNQIYKILLELQQAGQVTFEVQEQASLPAKKIYSVTDAGRAELQQALLQAPEAPEMHKDFLIQLAWAGSLSDDVVLALLTLYEAEVTNRLNLYRGQALRTENDPHRTPRETFLWRRIHDNFIQACQTELQWTRDTAQAIREQE